MGLASARYDVRLRLPERLGSAELARQFTRTTLAGWGYGGLHDDVVLVVSELVGNALLHSHGEPVLRMVLGPDRLRVEVSDDSPVLPVPRPSGPAGGWGLRLVDRLALAWGAAIHDDGKTVWCEIGAPAPPQERAATPAAPTATPASSAATPWSGPAGPAAPAATA